jgi:hypothetical protein
MTTTTPSQPESPAEAETSRAPKLVLVHGSAGLVFRLRALADDDRYAWNEWGEDILRQAADAIEKAEAGYQCYVRNTTKERERLIDALFAAYEHLPAGTVRDEADAILAPYEKPALPNTGDVPRAPAT